MENVYFFTLSEHVIWKYRVQLGSIRFVHSQTAKVLYQMISLRYATCCVMIGRYAGPIANSTASTSLRVAS